MSNFLPLHSGNYYTYAKVGDISKPKGFSVQSAVICKIRSLAFHCQDQLVILLMYTSKPSLSQSGYMYCIWPYFLDLYMTALGHSLASVSKQ